MGLNGPHRSGQPRQVSRKLAEPCLAEGRGHKLFWILAFHELRIISPQGPWGRVIQGTEVGICGSYGSALC